MITCPKASFQYSDGCGFYIDITTQSYCKKAAMRWEEWQESASSKGGHLMQAGKPGGKGSYSTVHLVHWVEM